MGFQVLLVVKNLPAKKETGDSGSIPGWVRSPGGGHGSLLQCSCLESPLDRGAWHVTVHGPQRVRHDLMTRYTYHCAGSDVQTETQQCLFKEGTFQGQERQVNQ